jgi:hypothetical protein
MALKMALIKRLKGRDSLYNFLNVIFVAICSTFMIKLQVCIIYFLNGGLRKVVVTFFQ